MPIAAAAARISRRSLVTLPFAHAAVVGAAASRPNVIVILVATPNPDLTVASLAGQWEQSVPSSIWV
jgi:hypothetical protein